MATKTVTEGKAETTSGNGGPPAAKADRIEVLNPADGSVVGTVPAQGAAEVRAAVARVRAAQPTWEALGPEGRYIWLGRLRDWILDHAEAIADVMQAETGKVRHEATIETPYLADTINFYGKNAGRFLADERLRPHSPLFKTKSLKIVYRPQPVVGIIAPWNFPLILSLGDAIPALAAGCGVVIKPSELTPLCLLEVVRAWKEEIGGPEVLEVVTGAGGTGAALVDEVDFVHFTGSGATGKKVMAQAAQTLTPVSLELGGKDPMVVLADADLERAVNGAAWGGLSNAGQICMSIERVYVEEPIYERFVERLTEKVSRLRQGPDQPAYSQDVGASTSPAQIGIVEDHVADAIAKGARVLTGGHRRPGPGDYFEPTVLVDVDHSMKIMRAETFGPVIPVMKVSDAEEAVKLANDSSYGLSGSVWGKDRERAERVARRLEVGACNVNDVLVNYFTSDVPMGGWKESGIGARHGVHGIRKFCRTESLVTSRLTPKSEPLWFPYSAKKGRLLRTLSRLTNARGLRRRLGIGKMGR